MQVRVLQFIADLALAGGLAFTSGPAQALPLAGSPSKPISAATKVTASAPAAKKIVVACSATIQAPFFLTASSRKMYSSARITACTVPPPQECKLVVETEIFNLGLWIPIKSATNNWSGTCLGKSKRTAAFKCRSVLVKHKFRTLVQLSILYNGKTASAVKASGVRQYFCD